MIDRGAKPEVAPGKKRMQKNEEKRLAIFKKITRERKKGRYSDKSRRDKRNPDKFGYGG